MSTVVHISSANELNALLSSTTYVAVDFFAEWCGPCKAIAPFVDSLAAKHGIPNILAFAKVDVDKAQDVAQSFGVTAMPTFIFLKNGKQVAVNGEAAIRGADAQKLGAAAEKLGRLALAKASSS